MGGTGGSALPAPESETGPTLGSPTEYPSTTSPGPYQPNLGGGGGGNSGGSPSGSGSPGGSGWAAAGQTSASGGSIPPGAERLPGSQEITSVLGRPATADPNAQPGAAAAGSSGQRVGGGQSGQAGSGGTASGRGARRPAGVIAGQGRGQNWGLPGGGGEHITAITRPIHIAVLADRFVVVPDAGDDRPPIHQRISPQLTQAEVDALVTSVQKEMKSWGLAVDGGYWKPILDIEVAPDAEQHFADLQMALQNSGFELQRKVR
ncbi:MAG: hypothetical protein L0211_11725 [Planctomycetaceae bacterium]|nr:hypothetical protein [Planctomycetaceae bacterium]